MQTTEFDKIILGIDPGTNILGYGVIGVYDKQMTMLSMGIVEMRHFEDHAQKLNHIFERVTAIIEQYKPNEIAIEAPFFGKNVQSMLKLGRAQGVAIAAGLQKKLPIFEYSPKKIKLTVTGNGNASKEQIADMLSHLLKFENDSHFLDATDALGAAVCHLFQFVPRKFGAKSSGKKSSWDSFIKDNPDKIKQI
ncbi:MAG: crossover junction endodeoxyribonuclease RuvC [Bacteroidia bacterium]|nr:crossover junction endodeoxyribonuclease RuvC [Bacteroidia bacterium]MCO5254878.1 crossover junction endodeoxyribonuclease RuvC [Bacteroidota bacterium]MCZ2128955.1 crossover junction endodeoxyribonuclease RuvC [Bacteroidia bacterium]